MADVLEEENKELDGLVLDDRRNEDEAERHRRLSPNFSDTILLQST